MFPTSRGFRIAKVIRANSGGLWLPHLRPHSILPYMNKSDLNEIKNIVNSALGTHLTSVHEEITDLRDDLNELSERPCRNLIGLHAGRVATIDTPSCRGFNTPP